VHSCAQAPRCKTGVEAACCQEAQWGLRLHIAARMQGHAQSLRINKETDETKQTESHPFLPADRYGALLSRDGSRVQQHRHAAGAPRAQGAAQFHCISILGS